MLSRAFCFSTKNKAQQNKSNSLSSVPIEYVINCLQKSFVQVFKKIIKLFVGKT